MRSAQVLIRDRGGEPAAHDLVVALLVGQAARRPVRLRGVASARAMKRRDVLERNQDVAVELDAARRRPRNTP